MISSDTVQVKVIVVAVMSVAVSWIAVAAVHRT